MLELGSIICGFRKQFVWQKLLWIGLILSLTACHSVRDRNDLVLDRADSLMQEYPDSALSLLETLSFSQKVTSSQSARYALLLTQAHDKNYVTHTDDSLIRIAVNYYDSIAENVGLQAKAHYYWGRVEQDRNRVPSCAREFLIAISLAEKAKDNNLLCLSYSNLGYVFFQEDLNNKADSCFQRARLLVQQSQDSTRLALILVNLGQNYIALGQAKYPAAKECLTHALVIAEKKADKRMERLATLLLSTLYSRLEDGRKAVEFAKRCIALSDEKSCFGAYLLLGDGYYKLGEYDSAQVYLNKSLPVDNYNTRLGAYMRLSDIAKVEKRYAEAIAFENLVTAYQDSVILCQQDVTLVSAIKDVQIHSVEKEQAVFFGRFRYLFFFLFLALATLIVFFVYKRKRYYLEALNAQLEHKKSREDLNRELELKTVALGQLQQLLSLRRDEPESLDVKQMREQICVLERERAMILKSLLKHVKVYLKMQQIICYYKQYGDYKEHFGIDDWSHLMISIDPSRQFYERLMACNDFLLDDEVHLCYLLQIGLSVIDISIVMGCTRDNIYKKKQTVYAKLKLAADNDDLKESWGKIAPLF